MKQDKEPVNTNLWREAEEATQRESVFWTVDHPRDEHIDRRQLSEAFKPQGGNAALEGVREALEGAQRMLAASRDAALPGNVARKAERIRPRVKEEIRGLIEQAIRQQAQLDVRRALAEVEHWKEYVKFYSGARPAPDTPAPAPAPVPDRRLPREPEDADDLPF